MYDKLNDDAHSYWISSLLANGAFVQVGYLNGLSTTNQFYCCAWFYEYFPPGNNDSPPIIGPPGSAGPIGSWHTYTMNYNASAGTGVWSFYMDNQYLGSSPVSGQPYYLGSGATNTGLNPMAALSEVAQTTRTDDVIGPAEFKNFQFEKSLNSLQPVPTGSVHIGRGVGSDYAANPYGVAEIENTDNDFLTGSYIPNTCGQTNPCGQAKCGNQSTVLWSSPSLPCMGSTFSFSFADIDGNSIVPDWISLNNSIYYSTYNNQLLPPGMWVLSHVSWHTVNVATGERVNTSGSSQRFLANVFSITLAVVGYFYSLPVKNATVILYLPDSTNQTLKTDANGAVVFSQLPPSTYTLRIGVPYGITSNQAKTITSPGQLVARVFSLPELITIIAPPILITIIASSVMVRREHRRKAMIRSQAIPGPAVGPMYCRSCGQPLLPTANFCTRCGTPNRMMVQ